MSNDILDSNANVGDDLLSCSSVWGCESVAANNGAAVAGIEEGWGDRGGHGDGGESSDKESELGEHFCV